MTRFLLAAFVLTLFGTADAFAKGKKKGKGGNKKGKSGGGSTADLSMAKGTMQLGGVVGGWLAKPMEGDGDFTFVIQPEVGYFVSKQFELFGEVGLSINDGLGYDLGGGGRYFFPMGGSNWAYAGAGAGYGGSNVEATVSTSAAKIFAQGGVIVALAKNVGLDIGIDVDIQMGEWKYVNLGFGYLGVQAYFK